MVNCDKTEETAVVVSALITSAGLRPHWGVHYFGRFWWAIIIQMAILKRFRCDVLYCYC